jgi:hypothetical protein
MTYDEAIAMKNALRYGAAWPPEYAYPLGQDDAYTADEAAKKLTPYIIGTVVVCGVLAFVLIGGVLRAERKG